MPVTRLPGKRTGLLAALVLAWPCQAQPPAGEDRIEPAAGALPQLAANDPYPSRFALTDPSWPRESGAAAQMADDPAWRSPPMESPPHILLRLKELDEIPLVTLWENTDASVFIGFDEDGRPGIHLRQKEDE